MREWSNSLVWFTALLLPLQALQGPYTLCHFVGFRNQVLVGIDKDSRCQCHQETTNSRLAGEGQQEYTARLLEGFGQTNPWDDCPPNCFCRRPAQPQCQPASPVQLKIAEGLAISITPQVPAKCIALLHGYADSQHERAATISALQFCVSLCRFTT